MQHQKVADTDDAQESNAASEREQDWTLEKDLLFTVVRPRLLHLARLRGVAPDEREDVVQETLLVAWKKRTSFQTPEHMYRWLDAICRNISARSTHASHQETLRHMPLMDEPLFPGQDGTMVKITASDDWMLAPDPADILNQQDQSHLLQQALNLLPSSAREAIELYYLLEFSQREAAAHLGLSISAMETRLHRARHQLREILGGRLREQAADLQFPLDAGPTAGWHATSIWCYYCGHQRLYGLFEATPGGERYLRMRCPECSRDFHSDIVNSQGLVGLKQLRSFQPAFKRTMRGVSRQLLQAVSTGTHTCLHCGKPARVEVGGPKQERTSTPEHPIQRRFWIREQCLHCGQSMRGFSADDVVYWSHPEIQEFMQRFPHWLSEPDLPIEFAGQEAILFRLQDRMSTAQLNVITHRQTLQVLTTFRR